MAFSIELSDEQWLLVADLFDPPGRRGAPARIARRQMVDAMLFLARTGCQWRYLPERFGSWGAVWQQWRRWRANGVWERAMARLAALIRIHHEREPVPSMVMIDGQTVKGGRYGPTFHQAGGRGGRTIGTKRTLLVEILGLPIAAHAESAKRHDVQAGRELLHEALATLPRVRAVVADPCATSPTGATCGSTSRAARDLGAHPYIPWHHPRHLPGKAGPSSSTPDPALP